jgi:hypothetical protein
MPQGFNRPPGTLNAALMQKSARNVIEPSFFESLLYLS